MKTTAWADRLAGTTEDTQMEFDLDRYFEAFNSGDEDAVVQAYFTEDVIVEGPDRTMHGRAEWAGMLKFMHDGIHEELRPVLVVREGDNLMAEVDAVFTASADRPDFFHGPLKAGETVKVKFFAVYRLRGHQIAHLTLAWWPANLRPL